MKLSVFAVVLMAATSAMAQYSIPRMPVTQSGSSYSIPRTPGQTAKPSIGIPRGEASQVAAQKLAKLTGLDKQDSRFAAVLNECATNDKEAAEYFDTLMTYLSSKEFKSQSKQQQKEELVEARIYIKMSCAQEANRAGLKL